MLPQYINKALVEDGGFLPGISTDNSSASNFGKG